ncbi:hypothetical protein DFA_02137 [Cavenderia fasciculata]|uniref:IPT/TIG domain-containing protein n=1 Tax=Cavenderia fasciculata TaxID=261658 RepID=F4PYT4_CACFS|nr:uncharacterized protein DFA_02137 [Cavenderia fasciculata]EGG19350.1 hypothetical protein DFA_02137 [Cavenderia fasciculata]|eukprot:XP_004357621.1 hypothetical protein DFA_02137 [Cavenderia fasciculata]
MAANVFIGYKGAVKVYTVTADTVSVYSVIVSSPPISHPPLDVVPPVASGSQLTITFPALPGYLKSDPIDATLIIFNAAGEETTIAFKYYAPKVTRILPDSGFKSGGTIITITGFNLYFAGLLTTITLGGVPCTVVNVPTAASIQCTTPSLIGSPSDLVKLHLEVDGNADTAAPEFLNYDLIEPQIEDFEPKFGKAIGGELLMITLNDNPDPLPLLPTSIMIGTAQCTSINRPSSLVLTCLTPTISDVSQRSLKITINLNSFVITSTSTFNYLYPTITSIQPESGWAGGGKDIIFSGDNLFAATSIIANIGDELCTGCTVITDNTVVPVSYKIKCTTPVRIAPYNLVLSKIVTLKLNNLEVLYPPTPFKYTFIQHNIKKIIPERGQPGSTITITGNNIKDGVVQINDLICPTIAYVVLEHTEEITCRVPTLFVNDVDVNVVIFVDNNPSILSLPFGVTTLPKFRYYKPIISNTEPILSYTKGTFVVTIQGQAFYDITQIKYGDNVLDSTKFNVIEYNKIYLHVFNDLPTIAHLPITLTTTFGDYSKDGFGVQFVEPSIMTMDTIRGIASGGTIVNIQLDGVVEGSSFEIKIGDRLCQPTMVVPAPAFGSVQCIIPPSKFEEPELGGTVSEDISIIVGLLGSTLPLTSSPSSQTYTTTLKYTYEGPSINNITPAKLSMSGGRVTIDGTNLDNPTKVTIGTDNCMISTTPTPPTPTQIICTLPPTLQSGLLNTNVMLSSGLLANKIKITIDATLPTILSISPKQGQKSVNTNLDGSFMFITINGINLGTTTATTSVTVGLESCAIGVAGTIVTANQIICLKPISTVSGPAEVVVKVNGIDSIDEVYYRQNGLSCFGQPEADGSNSPVDWFLIKKFPHTGTTGFDVNRAYMYTDSSVKDKTMEFKTDFESADSPLSMTYTQWMHDTQYGYMFFNDQVKGAQKDAGHVKGMLFWEFSPDGSTLESGVHIMHSQPHFPVNMHIPRDKGTGAAAHHTYATPNRLYKSKKYGSLWAGKSNNLGQHFFCYNLDAAGVDRVAEYFIKTNAWALPRPRLSSVPNPSPIYNGAYLTTTTWLHELNTMTIPGPGRKANYGQYKMNEFVELCEDNINQINLGDICYWTINAVVPGFGKAKYFEKTTIFTGPSSVAVTFGIPVDPALVPPFVGGPGEARLIVAPRPKPKAVVASTVPEKITQDGIDIWEVMVNYYKRSFFVSTYLIGQKPLFPVPGIYNVHVTQIPLPDGSLGKNGYAYFNSTDHSKLAFNLEPKIGAGAYDDGENMMCFGDTNRHSKQPKRGGGVLCIQSPELVYQFNRFVSGYGSVLKFKVFSESSPRDINLPAPAGITTIPLTFNPANVFNLVNRNPINSIAPTVTRFAPGDNVFGTGVIVPVPTVAPATATNVQLSNSLKYFVLYNGNLPVMNPTNPAKYLFVDASYVVPVGHKALTAVAYTITVHQTIRMERIPTLGYAGELIFDLYDYAVDFTIPAAPVNVYTPKTPNLLVSTTNVPIDRLLPPIKVMRTDLTHVGTEYELVYPDAHFKSIKGIKAHDAFAPLFVAYSQGVAGICLIGDIDPIYGCTLEKAIRSRAPTVTELLVSPVSPPPGPLIVPSLYGFPGKDQVVDSTRRFQFSGTDNTFKILKFVSQFQEELGQIPPLIGGLAASSLDGFDIAIDTTIAQSTVTVDGTTIILKSDQLCADELSYLLLLTVVARESNIKGHASPLAYGTSPLNWSNGILIAISKLISNKIEVPFATPSLIGGCFTAVGAIDLVTFADNVNIGSFKNTAAATWILSSSPDWLPDSMFKLLFKVKTTDHIQSLSDLYNMRGLPPPYPTVFYDKYIIIRPFSAKMDVDDDEPAARHMMSLFTIPTTTTSDVETNQNIVSPLQQLFNFIDQAAFTPDELLQLDNQQINLLKESLDKWVDISSENQGIKVLLKDPITQTSNQIIKYLDEVNSVQYGVSSDHIELCYLAIGGGGQQEYKIEICSPMSIVYLTNTLKRIQMTASTLSKNFCDLTLYHLPLSSEYDGYVSDGVDGLMIATLNSKLCDAQMTTLSSFQSNSFSTLCTQSGPIITSLSTNNGASIGGYQLLVNGYRFQSNLNITIGGVRCSQTIFQTSQLVQCVVPPNTGINHLVSFTSNHIQSTLFYFSYNQPIINNVLVSDITRSVSEITIKGANFGNSGGNDNSLYISIDQYQCFNIIQHVDSTIRCRIKSRVAANNFVNVSISNDNSNGIRQTSVFHLNQITNTQFNYSYVPNIVAVLPSHGFARDLVTVVGDSFANGDALPLSYFKDTRSTVLPPGDMGDDILTVRVPQITRDSQLLVSVDNIGSNLKSFTLDQPFIESISPSRVSSSGGVIIIKGGGWGMSRQAIDYVKLGSTPISCTPFNKFLECIVPPSTGEVNTLTVSFSGRVTTSYLSDYGMSYSTPRITSYTESSGVLTIRGVDFVNIGTQTSPQNSYLNVVSNMNRPLSYQQLTFVNKTTITATLTSLLSGESVESVQVLIFGMESNTYYHARYGCDGWVRNGDYNYIPLHYGVYPLKDYGFCTTPSCIASYQKSSGEAGCIIVVDSNTGVLTLSYEYTINLNTYVDAHIDGVFDSAYDNRNSELANSMIILVAYPTAGSVYVSRLFYPSMSRLDCPSICLINVSSTNASYIPIINNWRADFTVNKQPRSFDIGFYDKRIFGEPRVAFFSSGFGSGLRLSLPYGRFRISFECQSYTIPTNINVAVYLPGVVDPIIYVPPGGNTLKQATTFDVYRNDILNAYSGGLNPLGQNISFENIYHPRVPSYYIGTSLLVCSSIPPSNIWTCIVPPKTGSAPLTFSTYSMVGTTLTKFYKEFPITYTSVVVASGSVFMDYDRDNTFNNIDEKMAGHTVQIKSGSTVLASQNTVAGAIGFSFSMSYIPTNARIYIYPSPGCISYFSSFPFSSPIVKDFPLYQLDMFGIELSKQCQGYLTAGTEQLNLQSGTYDLSKFGWCKSPSVCANVITSETFPDYCTPVYSGTMVTIDYNAQVTLTFWLSNSPGLPYSSNKLPPSSMFQYGVAARSIINASYYTFYFTVPANGILKFNVPFGTTNLIITPPSIFDHIVDGTTIDFTTSESVPSFAKTLAVFSPATHFYNSASVNILSLPLGFYNFTWYSKQGQIKSFSAHPSMSIYVWNNAGTLYNVARNGNNIQLPDTLALTVENTPTNLYSFAVPPDGLQFTMPTPYSYVPFLFIEGLEIECENNYINCKIPSHIGGTTSKAKLKHAGTFFYHTWTITYQKRFEIPSAGSSYLAAGQSLTLGVNDIGVMIKYPLNPGVGQPYTYFSLSPTGIKIGFQAGPTNSHIYQVLSSQYDQSFTAPFSFKVESDYNIGLWGTKSGALSRGAWYLDKSPLPLQSSYLQVVRDGVIVQNSAGNVQWSRLKPLNYSGLARPLGAQIDYLDALDTNKNFLTMGRFLTNGESYLRFDNDGSLRLYNDNSFTAYSWQVFFSGGIMNLLPPIKWVFTANSLCAHGQSILTPIVGCIQFNAPARYLFVAPPTYGSSQFSMTVTNYFGALVYSQGSAPTSPYKMIPGTFMEFGDALIHGQFLTNGVEKLFVKPNGVFRREASGSETTLASGVVNAIIASSTLQFGGLMTVTPPGTYKYVFYPPPGHNLPNVDPVTKLVFVTAAGRGAGTSNPAAQFVIYDQKYWANI